MALKISSPRPYRGNRSSLIYMVLAIALAVIGLWHILFLSKAVLFIGYTSLLLAALFAALSASYHLKTERAGRTMRRVIWIAVLLAVLLALIVLALVYSASSGVLRDEPTRMIILGSQVMQNGPGPMLRSRLNTAYEYLVAHPDLTVVVSGGQGADEPCSEAQAMRDYLVHLGIDEARIWMEDQSHNTGENIRYTKQLLEARGVDIAQEHVLIVSNGFHLFRADMLAQRYGFDCSTLSAPPVGTSSTISSYIREIPAVMKSWLLD